MASFGQIIFYSMIVLIVLFSAVIILILSLAFTNSLSEVTSSNTMPVGNLGEDELLSCYVNAPVQQATFTQVSVTWEKKGLGGLVYKYAKGAPELGGQSSQFTDRTQLFPSALAAGNASLLLRAVKSSDGGEYTCSISSSGPGGKVSIQLRTAAFSAPTFTFSNGTLTAEASTWFPKPNVTWSDHDGNVLNGSTSFTQNPAGIFSLASELKPVNLSVTYTCMIQNNLVAAVSKATAGAAVLGNTYFIYSDASPLLASTYLSIMACVLCSCYLT